MNCTGLTEQREPCARKHGHEGPCVRAGRPTVEDKRRQRSVKWNGAEWSKVCAMADAAGMTAAAFVRHCVLGRR